jgi:hypothetical protein
VVATPAVPVSGALVQQWIWEAVTPAVRLLKLSCTRIVNWSKSMVTIAVPVPVESFGGASVWPSSVAMYTDCSAVAVEITPANKHAASKVLSFMLSYPFKMMMIGNFPQFSATLNKIKKITQTME